MDKIKDLTQGRITHVIGTLAAPLIGASFVQMAYVHLLLIIFVA